MSIVAAKLMTQASPMPVGAVLLGWIARHPAGRGEMGYAVLRLPGGEVAWDGVAIRSLPRDWRERVEWEAAKVEGV